MSEKGKNAETVSNIPTFSGREDWEDFERAVMLEAARKDLKGGFENLRGHKTEVHLANLRRLHMGGKGIPPYMSMWGKVVKKRAAAAVASSSFATGGTLSSALGLTGRQEDESDGEEAMPDLGDISEEDSEDSEGTHLRTQRTRQHLPPNVIHHPGSMTKRKRNEKQQVKRREGSRWHPGFRRGPAVLVGAEVDLRLPQPPQPPLQPPPPQRPQQQPLLLPLLQHQLGQVMPKRKREESFADRW